MTTYEHIEVQGVRRAYQVDNPPPGAVWAECVASKTLHLFSEAYPITKGHPQWMSTADIDGWAISYRRTLPWETIANERDALTVELNECDGNGQPLKKTYDYPSPTGSIDDLREGDIAYLYDSTHLSLIKILRKHDPARPWLDRKIEIFEGGE